MPDKTVTWWLKHHADVNATLAASHYPPGLRRRTMRRFVEGLEDWWWQTGGSGETWCQGRETVTLPFDPDGPFAVRVGDDGKRAHAAGRRTVRLRPLFDKQRVAIRYAKHLSGTDGGGDPDHLSWARRGTTTGLLDFGGSWGRWPLSAQDACFPLLDDLIVQAEAHRVAAAVH